MPTEPLVFTLAGILCFYLIWRRLARESIRTDILSFVLLVLGSGWLFARLWHFSFNHQGGWSAFLNPVAGGLTSFGMIIGTLVGSFLYSLFYERKNALAMFLRRYDCVAFYVVLWGFFANAFGCFIDGHRVGSITFLPWAVFRHGALRHPIDLYIGLLNLIIFIFLVRLFVRAGRVRKRFDGQVFASAMVLYGAARFFIEIWSAEQIRVFGLVFNQYAALAMIAAGALLYWRFSRSLLPSPAQQTL